MRNPLNTRRTLPWLFTACAACSEPGIIDDGVDDPACAGEDVPSARTGDELPWELDDELDSNRFACPPDSPDCDRLDEPDAIDELGEAIEEPEAWTPYGLSDPQTSTGRYRTWPNGRIPY